MHSSVWGGSYWYILHAITFAFDKENELHKENFKNIIVKIGNVLPCGVCRNHFKVQQRRHNIPYTDYHSISRWLYQRHQHVNGFLGKRNNPSYKDTEKMYFNKFNLNVAKRFFKFFMMSLKQSRLNAYRSIFRLFATTWPVKNQRQLIHTLTKTPKFNNAVTVPKLKQWYGSEFRKYIIENKPYPSKPEPKPEPKPDQEADQEGKVRFDTPEQNPEEKKKLKKKLKELNQRKLKVHTRLLTTRNGAARKKLATRVNNIDMKIRNANAKIYAL